MKVHQGGFKCEICHIPFTKAGLVAHQWRFHTKMVRKERILKALGRNVSLEVPNKNIFLKIQTFNFTDFHFISVP